MNILPRKCHVELSRNGKNFTKAGTIINTVLPTVEYPIIKGFFDKSFKAAFKVFTGKRKGICNLSERPSGGRITNLIIYG